MEQSAGYIKAANKEPGVNYEMVLGQIGGSRKKYGKFLRNGIDRGYNTPWDRVTGQVVLGKEEFIEAVKGRIEERGANREQPLTREFSAMSVRSSATLR